MSGSSYQRRERGNTAAAPLLSKVSGKGAKNVSRAFICHRPVQTSNEQKALKSFSQTAKALGIAGDHTHSVLFLPHSSVEAYEVKGTYICANKHQDSLNTQLWTADASRSKWAANNREEAASAPRALIPHQPA